MIESSVSLSDIYDGFIKNMTLRFKQTEHWPQVEALLAEFSTAPSSTVLKKFIDDKTKDEYLRDMVGQFALTDPHAYDNLTAYVNLNQLQGFDSIFQAMKEKPLTVFEIHQRLQMIPNLTEDQIDDLIFSVKNSTDKLINTVDQWESTQGLHRDELFIPNIITSFYMREEMKAEDSGRPKPQEQLTAKGLALISHLYAEQDQSECQPIIASSKESFQHLIKLIDKAPPGTNITVILQLADKSSMGEEAFGCVHKTTLKIEKKHDKIVMLNLDSLNGGSPQYHTIPTDYAKQALKENAQSELRDSTKLVLMHQDYRIAKDAQRQFATIGCGAFALKDARQLNRDNHVMNELYQQAMDYVYEEGDTDIVYETPAKYFKSAQSSKTRERVSPYASEIVNRKNSTLQEVWDKHEGSYYSHHFSKKYKERVETYLKTHEPEQVKEAVAKYDAASMTMERLVKIYGPESTARQTLNQLPADQKAKVQEPKKRKKVKRVSKGRRKASTKPEVASPNEAPPKLDEQDNPVVAKAQPPKAEEPKAQAQNNETPPLVKQKNKDDDGKAVVRKRKKVVRRKRPRSPHKISNHQLDVQSAQQINELTQKFIIECSTMLEETSKSKPTRAKQSVIHTQTNTEQSRAAKIKLLEALIEVTGPLMAKSENNTLYQNDILEYKKALDGLYEKNAQINKQFMEGNYEAGQNFGVYVNLISNMTTQIAELSSQLRLTENTEPSPREKPSKMRNSGFN